MGDTHTGGQCRRTVIPRLDSFAGDSTHNQRTIFPSKKLNLLAPVIPAPAIGRRVNHSLCPRLGLRCGYFRAVRGIRLCMVLPTVVLGNAPEKEAPLEAPPIRPTGRPRHRSARFASEASSRMGVLKFSRRVGSKAPVTNW